MAAIAGVDQATWSRWERGLLEPTLGQIASVRAEAKRRRLRWNDGLLFETPLDSAGAIIGSFGGPDAFERAIGLPSGHGRVMKHRDSIPPRYWSKIVEQAALRGLDGISYETLANIASLNGASSQKRGAK